ncbi:anthranilate synthase/aminodeoxychorismate synthase-like glutamine amidotransferase [Curtobacterium luteum]|uniref:Aminodeoxychorismate/anthranilate synthase component 2 n=1 Tax=Curtobacterium luteum TaxID=33881 RepID=A0A8H9G9V0_9MICO|nr:MULTISPECIES: aminodeoxychorismate/anthranilate synthase component II [Curtobacterium]MBM7803486.1 anthranilate synthase/aminodeoxychorismate synthase-like glutamine amidotransferase [Curtobacterium luteum]NUU50237.1 aminodeoxychorismate/anthranilate synthase component II [Curtobacterium luteum]GGL00149.1 aminodeoxychorismate/anthranilate synthase component 2 [Curtobacterium luteum]
MRSLLIDAQDSFVYIIAQYLRTLGGTADVIRSADADGDAINRAGYDLVLLGPGPGTPTDAGHTQLMSHLAIDQAIFGVCLGHQAIAEHFGASIGRADRPMHGKQSSVTHDGSGVFTALPSPLAVTRYHSLAVDPSTVPDELVVSATADDGTIMALRHDHRPIESVQFHPESIGTDFGIEMLRSFVCAHGLTGRGRA